MRSQATHKSQVRYKIPAKSRRNFGLVDAHQRPALQRVAGPVVGGLDAHLLSFLETPYRAGNGADDRQPVPVVGASGADRYRPIVDLNAPARLRPHRELLAVLVQRAQVVADEGGPTGGFGVHGV